MKVAEKQNMRHDEELEGCTFHPQILGSPFRGNPATEELNELARNIAAEM